MRLFKFFQKNKSVSKLGRLVDFPIEDFKKEVEKQHLNIGSINILLLNLNSAYSTLVGQKDQLIDECVKLKENEKLNKKRINEIQKAVKGIYFELTKLEQKIVYLKDRSQSLLDLDNKGVD